MRVISEDMIAIELKRPGRDKPKELRKWSTLDYLFAWPSAQWPPRQIPAGLVSRTVSLIVNQGGLQNRDFNREAKDKFREEIAPWLAEQAGAHVGTLTCKVALHVAENTVRGVELKIQ